MTPSKPGKCKHTNPQSDPESSLTGSCCFSGFVCKVCRKLIDLVVK